MKSYQDIRGDGGSDLIGQVQAQERAIRQALARVRHRVAIGSGKGGVGKSTVTMALARSLAADGRTVAILDCDFNGPCQARLAGLAAAPWIPDTRGLAMPRTADGIGVVSFGSLLPEARPLELDSVAEGVEHVWRATREFALLGQLLASIDWGRLDFLLLDLPPGAERTVQFAQFLGAEAAFVLVTVPSEVSRGVVARSIAALERTANPVLGYIENMAGYLCRGCGEVQPLFPASEVELSIPRLGAIPFDPELAALCDRGRPYPPDLAADRAVAEAAGRIVHSLEP